MFNTPIPSLPVEKKQLKQILWRQSGQEMALFYSSDLGISLSLHILYMDSRMIYIIYYTLRLYLVKIGYIKSLSKKPSLRMVYAVMLSTDKTDVRGPMNKHPIIDPERMSRIYSE